MPIFEFVCDECGEPFEELVRSASAINAVNCPDCGSSKITKKLSLFASKTVGSSSFSLSSASTSACNTGST